MSEQTRTIALSEAGVAQAVFGPLHRHLALIQEAFRDPNAPRGHAVLQRHARRAGRQDLRARANDRRTRSRAAAHCRCARRSGAPQKARCAKGEVLAAIAFSEGETDRPGPMHLPQLGGLTLRTPRQVHYVEALRDESIDLIFGVGPAGTGKTFLAVAAAVEALKQERVDRIIVTRPAVEAGEKLGYLPGDLAEKVDPYLQPIWDAFRGQMGETDLKARRERKQIEVAPLAFMRGRTLSNAFVIVDEAQNATVMQMKMVHDSPGRRLAHGRHRRPKSGRPAAHGSIRSRACRLDSRRCAWCRSHSLRYARRRPSQARRTDRRSLSP